MIDIPNDAWSYNNKTMLKKYYAGKIFQPNGYDIIKFHPDFLRNCWTQICEFNLQHHRIGNVIKKLAYDVNLILI